MIFHPQNTPPYLGQVLSTDPPTHLWHYTSPAGLIGICKTKTVWATAADYMNDQKEHRLATDSVRHHIKVNLLGSHRARYTDREALLLERMADSAAPRAGIYTFSLSAKRDSVSQWAAYCPPSGGYSIGLPSSQLRAIAREQGFYLAPCLYKHHDHWRLLNELMVWYLDLYRSAALQSGDSDELIGTTAWSFGEALARYAPIIKHSSFEHEGEWRLISEPKHPTDPQVAFRSGPRSVVPYYELRLTTDAAPQLAVPGAQDRSVIVVVGPTVDNSAAQLAVQALMQRHIGEGCWHGPSDTPYRGY